MTLGAAPAPTLVDLHCSLRALTPADTAATAIAIACHANRPAVAHNLFEGFPQPCSLAVAQAWCVDLHRLPAYGTVWAVDVAGNAIGCASERPDSGWLACNAAVVCWLGRAHWRCAIARRAAVSRTAT